MLAILGGAGGLALAASGSRAIVSLLSRGRIPILLDVSIDARLLVFALGVTLATTVVFGLWPAFAATRQDLQSRLTATTRTVIGSNRRRAQALLTAQTVFSFVLVIAAGLFTRSLTTLYRVDLGLERHQALVVRPAAAPTRFCRSFPSAWRVRPGSGLSRRRWISRSQARRTGPALRWRASRSIARRS